VDINSISHIIAKENVWEEEIYGKKAFKFEFVILHKIIKKIIINKYELFF
jgi:hypothetical protein